MVQHLRDKCHRRQSASVETFPKDHTLPSLAKTLDKRITSLPQLIQINRLPKLLLLLLLLLLFIAATGIVGC